jgi:hypothetical protein
MMKENRDDKGKHDTPAARKRGQQDELSALNLKSTQEWTPAIHRYAARVAQHSGEGRLSSYNKEKTSFEQALKKWPEKEARQLKETLEALRFIDWAHMADDLLETYRSRGRLNVLERNLQYLYNATGTAKDPQFRNMAAVTVYLKSTKEAPGLERLLRAHALAMKNKVDGIERKEVGAIRSHAVVGIEDEGLTAVQIRRINRNPYLTFEATGTPSTNARGGEVTPGHILYPEPESIKDEALQRIAERAPGLVQQIIELKAKSENGLSSVSSREYAALTQALITELAEERYHAFNSQCQALGALDTPEKVLTYIKFVAAHYRDLISIHPLGDGNGRTLRYESLYAPLDAVGISRPRLQDVNTDVLNSPSGWLTEVQRGILSTDQVYQDITKRINLGLRIESCPELVFPNMIREVGIELRTRGRKGALANAKLHPIDGGQFGAYVDTRMMADARLVQSFKDDPVSIIQQLRDDYKTFAKSSMILAHVPHKGIEEFGLYLVDFDQRATFGVPFSAEREKWLYKRDRWYLKETIWRGMCSEDAESTTDDVLDIFRRLSWISLSNNASSTAGKQDPTVRKAVQKDFDAYNRDLLSGRLVEMARDHVGEGALYDSSYGLSTSRRREIAAGFAWGLGRFGYQDKEVKQAQDRIKSRVLIGALQATKDVDVRRLKMVAPQFSYEHGRQQEIMAVGGIDPDMIMTVQLLDRNRKVERSFVRNPEKPDQILEVRGQAEPSWSEVRTEKHNTLIRVHQLF